MACRPIGKKIALVQCAASAASTAGVFFGHGPSSKVSTTSPSRRKSWLLKCSKPKPGPPVVSISTVRETPSALGLPGHETAVVGATVAACGGAAAAGAGAGAAAAAAGACARTVAGAGAGIAAGVAPPCAFVVGELGIGAASAAGSGLLAACTGAGGLASSTVVTTRNGVSEVAAWAGDVEAIGTEDRWERMAPNTATHMTIISAHAIAARRMAISPT